MKKWLEVTFWKLYKSKKHGGRRSECRQCAREQRHLCQQRQVQSWIQQAWVCIRGVDTELTHVSLPARQNSIKQAVGLLNGLQIARLPPLLSRIAAKVHLKVRKEQQWAQYTAARGGSSGLHRWLTGLFLIFYAGRECVQPGGAEPADNGAGAAHQRGHLAARNPRVPACHCESAMVQLRDGLVFLLCSNFFFLAGEISSPHRPLITSSH